MTNDARENTLDHIYKLFHADLQLCGCGDPTAAYSLVRDLLNLAPLHERTAEEVEAVAGPPGTCHFVLSMLTSAGLLEHGGSIGGSWLTPKGEWLRAALLTVADWEELEDPELNVGLPHSGDECTAACWDLPVAAAAAG